MVPGALESYGAKSGFRIRRCDRGAGCGNDIVAMLTEGRSETQQSLNRSGNGCRVLLH
jgi:hypothetical protein